jgi:hypothetical protein
MKNLLGCLLIVMLGFTACLGPIGPEGPPGKDAESTQWSISDYNVSKNQWVPKTDLDFGPFFECEVYIPDLTKFVFDEGAVTCYLVWSVIENGKATFVHSALPYTRYGDDSGYLYSENYSYEVKPGFIKFIAKYSDFSAVPPMDCTFHVVLMW